MLRFEARKGVPSCDGLTRREFLRVGALGAGALGVSLGDLARLAGSNLPTGDVNCIVLFLVGGPGHLDTWDLKPLAPSDVRGPFSPTSTNVPGIQIGEHFPLMARMANHYAIIRSVHHDEAPIHETGHQLMQTGRVCRGGLEMPHYGAVCSYLRRPQKAGVPPFVVLPETMGNTGVSVSHGQSAGFLGASHEPVLLPSRLLADGLTIKPSAAGPDTDPACLDDPNDLVSRADAAQRAFDDVLAAGTLDPDLQQAYERVFAPSTKKALALRREKALTREAYGWNTFGQSCLLARRLIESGVRLVTVNMFDTVFNKVTWDCHADGGSLPATLADYKNILCPMFDRAYTALLADLADRGQLQNTLVVAMGEFGRTPRLNPRGGRDHWPGCWSILMAGGPVRPGQIIGASDAIGAEPLDRPVTPAEVAATVYRALGVDLAARLPGPDGQSLPLVDADPIGELLGL
jgi:uncharacterized protein (DUF1501 family)